MRKSSNTMSKKPRYKKYTSRVVLSESGWLAEILRRMTSKKQIVTKSKDGFSVAADAQAWADEELKVLLVRLKKQSKQRSEDHAAGLNYDKL